MKIKEIGLGKYSTHSVLIMAINNMASGEELPKENTNFLMLEVSNIKKFEEQQLKKENREYFLITEILKKEDKFEVYRKYKEDNLLRAKKYEKIDEELLKLLLTAFLSKSDLENGFDIAKKGLELFPDSEYWLEMYSKISLWTGRTGDAFWAYKKLVEKNPSLKNIEGLFKMALATNRFDVASKIMIDYPDQSFGIKDIKDIVYIFTQSGNIEDLVAILRRKYEKEGNPEILYHLSYISFNYGDLEKALEYIERLEKIRQLSIKEIMLYADITYSLKKSSRAFRILKKYANYVETVPFEPEYKEYILEFYKSLSDFGWFEKDIQTVEYASTKLIELKSGRLVDYIRLYLISMSKKDYTSAEKFAKEGFDTYKYSYLLEGYIETLYLQQKWREIHKLISKLPLRDVYKKPYILSIFLKSLLNDGNASKAREVILYGLRNEFSEELLLEAVVFSIESKDIAIARHIINTYKQYEDKFPKHFAILHFFLQNSNKSLSLLKKFPVDSIEDKMFLADTLILNGDIERGKKIKYQIFKSILSQKEEDKDKYLEILLRFGMEFLPAQKYRALLSKGKNSLSQRAYEEIYFSYLALLGEQDRLKYMMNIYKKTFQPWLYLNLSLWEYDKYWQDELLERFSDILPIRDRVEALRRTGQISKAGYYGFKGLEENREDYLLYKQYRDLITNYYSKIENTLSYTSWDKVESVRDNLSIRYYLNKGLYINYDFSGFFNLKNNNPIYRNIRDIYFHGLKVSKLEDDGKVEAGVSYLKGVEERVGFTFKYNTYLKNRSYLELSAGLNQPSYESVFMFLGGMKDSYSLSFTHNLNSRASISLVGTYDRYKSQDDKTVGDGSMLYGEGSYKLRIGYPDYTFRLYLQNSVFNEKNTDKGSINKISSQPNPDVLPPSYTSVGGGFLFGFDNRDNYVRVWRPFFSADVVFNNRTGLGYGASAGVGGSIFRQDNLSTGFRYIQDFRGTTTSFWELFLKYNLFF